MGGAPLLHTHERPHQPNMQQMGHYSQSLAFNIDVFTDRHGAFYLGPRAPPDHATHHTRKSTWQTRRHFVHGLILCLRCFSMLNMCLIGIASTVLGDVTNTNIAGMGIIQQMVGLHIQPTPGEKPADRVRRAGVRRFSGDRTSRQFSQPVVSSKLHSFLPQLP